MLGRFDGEASLPDATGFIDLSGQLTIIGGTGRFLGATGSGSVAGTVNVTRRTCCVTGKAWITLTPADPFPGS